MTTATLGSPLLDVKQLAEFLGEGEENIRLLVKRREISCIRRNGRSIKFTERHVAEYLARFEVPATTEPDEPKPARNPRYTK